MLGVAIQAFMLKGETGPRIGEPPAFIAVVLGMVFGVAHSSQFWLDWIRRPSRWRYLEVLLCAFICIALGILWGSLVAVIALQFGFGLPLGVLFLIPIFGVLLSEFSVLPAAVIMAPVTVLIWHVTLRSLGSKHGSGTRHESSVNTPND
jgi:hypothetical protein